MLRILRAEYEKGVADTIVKYEQAGKTSSWKPSKEQMEALEKAYCGSWFTNCSILRSLYNDLTKLM